MKVEFLKEVELELIHNKFSDEDSIDFGNWNLMTDEEMLICDAEMFADEVYCDNEFDSIEEFAVNISDDEGSTAEFVMKRLKEMLDKGILKLI